MGKFIALVALVGILTPFFALTTAPAPVLALRDPCALDPNNVVYNGSMGPEHDTPYGSAADGWNPFIFDGTPPQFRWVGNEQIDPNGSQQIYSTNTFDAGVQQTVRNLQPGVYYWIRWGYSLAAKSYSGPNVRVDSIGRKLGIDPTGGTDPHSPNIIWGPDFFDGNAALNIPALTMVFPARASTATVFLRAMARDGSGGENRVWMDAICMEAKSDLPTATPQVGSTVPTTGTPTSPAPIPPTPVPPIPVPPALVPSTATAVPANKTAVPAVAVTNPTVVPPTATKVPPTRTKTPTRLPTIVAMLSGATPPPVNISAAVTTIQPVVNPQAPIQIGAGVAVSTPRYARPVSTPSPEGLLTLNADILTGFGVSSILGSFVLFAFGIVLARRPD